MVDFVSSRSRTIAYRVTTVIRRATNQLPQLPSAEMGDAHPLNWPFGNVGVDLDLQSGGLPTMTPPPRTQQQRKQDALNRLEHDTDARVATADGRSGTPYLVPLSFLWDGISLLVATPSSSPTSRNLLATGKVRLGIGPTRDLVLTEGTVQALAAAEIPEEVGDAFAAKTGFDPRQLTSSYLYFRIHPQRLQAWREANELKDRELMRGGHWVVP